MKICATITAVDSPREFFYTAKTNFGDTVTGVSLRGGDVTFNVGDQVAVFEIDGSFGAFDKYGQYPSVLTVPGSLRQSVYPANPANTALAMLAKLANNNLSYYEHSTVTAISGNRLEVSGNKISGLINCSGVKAGNFNIGDEVMIRTFPSISVLGWWNTAPFIYEGIPVFQMLRQPFSPDIIGGFYNYLSDGSFVGIQKQFTITKSGYDFASTQTNWTDNDADNYYTKITFTDSIKPTIIEYYSIDKTTLMPTEIDAGDMPLNPSRDYHIAAGGKPWKLEDIDITNAKIVQANGVGLSYKTVIETVTTFQAESLPVQDYEYEAIL